MCGAWRRRNQRSSSLLHACLRLHVVLLVFNPCTKNPTPTMPRVALGYTRISWRTADDRRDETTDDDGRHARRYRACPIPILFRGRPPERPLPPSNKRSPLPGDSKNTQRDRNPPSTPQRPVTDRAPSRRPSYRPHDRLPRHGQPSLHSSRSLPYPRPQRSYPPSKMPPLGFQGCISESMTGRPSLRERSHAIAILSAANPSSPEGLTSPSFSKISQKACQSTATRRGHMPPSRMLKRESSPR